MSFEGEKKDADHVFTKRSEIEAFLQGFREGGATNMEFTIVGDVLKEGDKLTHVDTFVCDNGNGGCEGTWILEADGEWRMVSDKIWFVPRKETTGSMSENPMDVPANHIVSTFCDRDEQG